VLADVLLLHAQIQSLLRGSRQRLRQARELFRIDADLLAHTCLLLGDVSRDHASAAYGTVAVLCAAEADSSPALAFSAQAQVARWQHRYSDAADLAARGFACSPATSLRVLLAGQEANAAALARDTGRARAALARAEAASTGPAPASAWSCPPARHALYRLGVALHVGDARWALREADAAASYGIERAQAFGTWAHLQVGAAIAHLMLGSVENAAGQLGPVLDLAAEYRLATVVEHMAALNSRLAQRRFRDAPAAAELRERITDFTRGACAG
jgi:hypothetical protein